MRGDWEAILNAIRLEVAKHVAQYKWAKVGIVDSWDKKTHTAKVKLQPSGQLTGWLPVGGGVGAGKGRGFAHGLTKGDQVVVSFHDGSMLTPMITHRLWSEKDTPIKDVESGDDHWVGKEKQWVKMIGKDKELILRGYPGHDKDDDSEENDKSSAKVVFDKDGNLTRTLKKGDLKGDIQQGKYELKHAKDAHFKPGKGSAVKVGEGQLLRVVLEDGSFSEVLLAAKK